MSVLTRITEEHLSYLRSCPASEFDMYNYRLELITALDTERDFVSRLITALDTERDYACMLETKLADSEAHFLTASRAYTDLLNNSMRAVAHSPPTASLPGSDPRRSDVNATDTTANRGDIAGKKYAGGVVPNNPEIQALLAERMRSYELLKKASDVPKLPKWIDMFYSNELTLTELLRSISKAIRAIEVRR